MNIKNKNFLALLICICLLSFNCLCADEALLSPAIRHIEKQLTLKKCAIYGENVKFSKADFDGVLCSDVEFIIIEKLPDASSGKLMMNSLKLSENQIVERDDFGKMVFCPVSPEITEASFVFSNATAGEPELAVNCVIHFLEEENRSPVASDQTVSTYENVAVFKFLGVADPENDELSLQIVSYPSHGTLRIANDSKGHFSYTPEKGYTGSDSFEYVAFDRYGNKSRKATVKVNVSETGSDIYFDDLSQHWAHNSAIKTSAMGLMSGSKDADGKFCFMPQGTVTRGDFLAMALISAGKEPEIEFVTHTSFDDDAEIPMNIKSYAEYARKCGIVAGFEKENGDVYFNSGAEITRAEAAVIIDRILQPDTEEADISVFADSASVPSWASTPLSRLTRCGILHGTGFGELLPGSLVTRAQAAEMMCNIRVYMEN